jgi:putative Holliday junction resolvase
VSVLLGLDVGERRIGVASGDTASGAVASLLTLSRGTPREDAEVISRLCAERRAVAVVVGLPLHLDGSESEQSRRTREWASAIEDAIGVPVIFRDERLSSLAAEVSLGRQRRGRAGGPPSRQALRSRRARIDREAAALIVQRELDARAAADAEVEP